MAPATYWFMRDILVGGRGPEGLSIVQVKYGDSCKRAWESTSSKLPNNVRANYPPLVRRGQYHGEPVRDLRADPPVLRDQQPSLSSCISGRSSESNLGQNS